MLGTRNTSGKLLPESQVLVHRFLFFLPCFVKIKIIKIKKKKKLSNDCVALYVICLQVSLERVVEHCFKAGDLR